MMSGRPKVLFVDDEARVLTSMRAMFRRDHEVHVATSGADALRILRQQSIDVVVSDQRMPGMTGVELLREARELAPRTMRILLTGYADLAAIEHAINEAEVFRYLMKPCGREQLREVVALAVEASRSCAVAAGDGERSDGVARARVRDSVDAAACGADEVGFLVLSTDAALAESVRTAIGPAAPLARATNVAEALRCLAAASIGVLVTDLAVDEEAITELTTELRREVPELVTIVASARSDAHRMIDLINHGQVFRFLLKPMAVGQSRIWLSSAAARHRELADRPELRVRYRPDGAAPTAGRGMIGRMLAGLRASLAAGAPA